MKNFKAPFNFEGQHQVEALVITCMDFRFWEAVTRFVKEELEIKSFDFPNLPGVSKAINESEDEGLPMQCVKIGCDLHQVEKIILVDHADCGAYGGVKKFDGDIEKEHKFHEEELKKAGEKLKENHPDKETILVFAKLVDDGENVEFVVID